MRYVQLTAGVCVVLSACGGGGNGGGSGVPETVTLTAGQSATIVDGMVAMVPAGTTVSSPNGGLITIGGDNSSLMVQSGAVVNVPASATGSSDDTVVASSSGAKLALSSNVSLVAGSATTNLSPVDGSGATAVFWGGGTIGVMPNGGLVVTDRAALREISPNGVVSTVEPFGQPIDWQGIAVDAAGNIFGSGAVQDQNTGVQSTAFAKLSPGNAPYVLGVSLPAGGVSLGFGGLSVDSTDALIFADAATNRVLRFVPGVGTTVLAGSGAVGSTDGTGVEATFDLLADTGVTVDAAGNAFLLSDGAIRKITPQGVVTTVASALPVRGGPLALDASGSFYIGLSTTVYKVDAHGTASTYAELGTSDFITALATNASGNLFVGTRGVGAQIFKVTSS